MGGGLMQLVAMGAQDVYLTGNPQITFFKVVYRRHTNFSKECIKQTFNGNADFDSDITCTLSRNGDLVQEIYLKVVLGIMGKTGTDNHAYELGDITSLIEHVEVEIGGQKIDKHYSQWLDIYNELFETDSSYGRKNLMTSVPAKINDPAAAIDESKTFYLPLHFWFNRNPGLALPLIALQYHEVKINIKLAAVAKLFGGTKNTVANVLGANMSACGKGTTAPTNDTLNLNMSSCDLLVNYLYLDTDERRRFAQVSHEYLIEQVQHTGVETSQNHTLNFNHPVKALFWSSSVVDTAIKLQLNGHDRFSAKDADYFHLLQPYECGLGHSKTLNVSGNSNRRWASTAGAAADSNSSMYSFCLKPAEHQPSGTCNFSRIDNAKLNFAATGTRYIFAMNYNVLRIMSGMGGLAYSN